MAAYSHISLHGVVKVEITPIHHHENERGSYEGVTLWLYGNEGQIVHYAQIYSPDNTTLKINIDKSHTESQKEPAI